MRHALTDRPIRGRCRHRAVYLAVMLCALTGNIQAQDAVHLPSPEVLTAPTMQTFFFASDGPTGPGWSRPDEIPRVYFHETLPSLFQRTIALEERVPEKGRLSWIFTGPHAGVTVELTPSKVRLIQRFYDSSALYSGQGSYPEKIVREDERQYLGEARSLTVVVDSHLSVQVLLNGMPILRQACTFDLTRHQLMFAAPRVEHRTLAGALLSVPVRESSIHVDSSLRHQTMLGFGGSPSIPAYAALSDEGKTKYWELLRRYNLLLDREYPMGSQLKLDLSNMEEIKDATPHYYGDNFPNGEVSSFEYSRHAIALGGEVIYEMWALPGWATQPYLSSGPPIIDAWNKKVTVAARPEEYARIVVTYCRMAKLRTGSAPAIVGIQNEVEQPPEIFDAMILALRRELDAAGFQSTRIHMADASYLYLGAARVKDLRNRPSAWKATDFAASHEYDFQEFFANPDLFDDRMKTLHAAIGLTPFLATEICVNDSRYQELSYRIAFNVGQIYQKNLTELDAEALMYCWLLLDVEQPNFGGSRSLLVPDKSRGNVPVASSFQLRVLGAYSRHVLKGMIRVTSVSDNPDLLTTAFEDQHRASLVVLNRSTEPQRLHIDWPARNWTETERTSQTLENSVESAKPDLVVQPGEIITLSNFSPINKKD